MLQTVTSISEVHERICPTCGNTVSHTSKASCRKADKNRRPCIQCGYKKLSNYYIGKTLEQIHGKNLAERIKKKISASGRGRKKSPETREKIRQHRVAFYQRNPTFSSGKNNPMYGVQRFGKDNPNFGRKWTDDQKRRQGKISKERIIQRALGGVLFRNDKGTGGIWYNARGCRYMDKWSKKMGCNLRHARNEGEQYVNGFFADGFDTDKNIWFEYDESHHYYRKGKGDLKKNDVDRMNTIIKDLRCQFWRYNETTKQLKRYA